MVIGMKRKPIAITAVLVAAAAAIGYGVTSVSATPGTADAESGKRPPACVSPPEPNPNEPPTPPAVKPTTVTTIGQAYYCILDNYYSGPVLDHRTLLVPAFAAVTQELQRRGLDQATATMPALTGKKDADWAAFSRAYEKIAAGLPQDTALRQSIADAAMRAMVDSLHDNHARWQRPQLNTGAPPIGVRLSGLTPGGPDPAATAPVYVTEVSPGSGAANAGIKPGDEIVTVNDVPPYVNGELSKGVLEYLRQATKEKPVRLTLRRPVTGATFTVTVTPVDFPRGRPKVDSKLLDGDVAYVKLPGFFRGGADEVLKAIADLRKDRTLRGVVLDLRGNGGGSPTEVARLLGALAHDKITSYWCDVREHCTPNRTDDSVPLVKLPVVTLTDRGCASACDSFSSAVKDLRLGTLVGTRTAGAVSGPASPFVLDDGSSVMLPKVHEIAANREVVNTIGVAPDHHAPVTSADLSAGHDPGVAKALTFLR